jgi:hypothetical protein
MSLSLNRRLRLRLRLADTRTTSFDFIKFQAKVELCMVVLVQLLLS